MAGFTAFDIIILLSLGAGLVTGFLRGFVQEVLSLAALLVALFALRLFHAPLSTALEGSIGTAAGASALAFALIMGVIWGGGKFVASRIGGATRSSFVGPFDRVLGGGFGMIKSLLIAATVFMLLMLVYDVVYGPRSARPTWLATSRTYPLIRATSAALSDVIAERLNDARATAPPATDAAP
ncbi:MAG: CvpA family protein [Pseudomonadota bacterium]